MCSSYRKTGGYCQRRRSGKREELGNRPPEKEAEDENPHPRESVPKKLGAQGIAVPKEAVVYEKGSKPCGKGEAKGERDEGESV